MSPVIELDARRLLCPMPVIRLIPTWCRINGHRVLATEQLEHEYIFLVQKDPDGT
jgi:TusA-related sulfurtransferase